MAVENENAQQKVEQVRQTFTSKFTEGLSTGAYHPSDLERLQNDDAVVRCFLKHQKQDVEKTAAMVDSSFRWRKELGVNDLTEKDFPRELHEIGFVFYHQTDKDENPILYFQGSKCKKDSEKNALVKKYIAWWIDKHWLKHPDQPIVVCLDMTGTGITNMDLEIAKFQISCFATYYPAFLAYMLIFEMPWVLNAIWKIVRNLLSAEQQKYVMFVKKADVQQYVPKDRLLVHMGGMNNYKYTYMPSEDSGIELLDGDVTPTSPVTPTSLVSEVGDSDPGSSPASPDNTNAGTPDDSLLSIKSKNNSPLKKRVTFSGKDDTRSFADREPAELDSKLKKSVLLAKQKNKDRVAFVGSLLTIRPGEQLEFSAVSTSCDILTFENSSTKQVAFKVKTTSPDRYRVRPSSGLIQPSGTADILISLQGDLIGIDRDKFLVLAMQVDDTVTCTSQAAELWKTAVKTADNYMEHRLRCVHVFDSTPPLDQQIQSCLQSCLINSSQQGPRPPANTMDAKMEELLRVQVRLEASVRSVRNYQILTLFLLIGSLIMLGCLYVFVIIPGISTHACHY